VVKKKSALIPVDLRRSMVSGKDAEFSITQQCKMLGIQRSGVYYKPAKDSDRDLEIMKVMDALYMEDPARGTRRYRDDLRELGHVIGRDKVRSLMRIMGIEAIYCRPRTTVLDPTKYKFPYLLRGLEIDRPNQAWGIDISYIPMRRGFMYLCAIIDIYSRYIVGWSISNTMEAKWVVETVETAVERYGKPEIINSDQGAQFTSEEYVNYIKGLGSTRISMDGKGRATDNAHIERFFRTIKYDKLYRYVSKDGKQLFDQCKQFINFYNRRRSHSSIGRVPPLQKYQLAA